MKVDREALVQVIERCFVLSMDVGLPEPMRKELNALGKRLRGSLMNLLTAHFDEGTQAVTDANAKIHRVGQQLAAATASIERTADTIEQLAELTKVLDDLLKIAVSFA